MNSPLYYDPYHHDPTIIGVHTLLKPQAYQQSPYFNTPPSPSLSNQYNSPQSIPSINTHIPPAHTYPNFIANNSPHNLPHHINSVIQELHHSQRVCIQAISNLASDISTLNKSLTPPSLTYNNSTTSLTSFLYQQPPLTPSNISPPNLTYQQPHITTTTTNMIDHNSQHYPDSFSPPLKISTHPYTPHVTSRTPLPLYNSNKVTTEIDVAKKVVPNLRTHSDPISHVVGEHNVVVDNNFNVAAPSKLVLDSTTTFSTATAERSRDDVVTTKGHEEGIRQVPPSISQSPCDSIRVAFLTIKSCGDVYMGLAPVKINVSFGSRPSSPPYKLTGTTSNDVNPSVKINVPMSLAPAKHCSISITRPSLPSYLFIGMSVTSKDDNTLSRATTQEVLNHKLFVSNFEHSFDFPALCTFNFDPGGNKSSLRVNYDVGRCIFSLLWLPWDRGKKSCSEAVFALQSCSADACL